MILHEAIENWNWKRGATMNIWKLSFDEIKAPLASPHPAKTSPRSKDVTDAFESFTKQRQWHAHKPMGFFQNKYEKFLSGTKLINFTGKHSENKNVQPIMQKFYLLKQK